MPSAVFMVSNDLLEQSGEPVGWDWPAGTIITQEPTMDTEFETAYRAEHPSVPPGKDRVLPVWKRSDDGVVAFLTWLLTGEATP